MSEKKINPVKANAKDVIRIYREASKIGLCPFLIALAKLDR